MFKNTFTLLVLLILSCSARAILLYDGATIIGANNVIVSGSAYNVSFVDGAFLDVYGPVTGGIYDFGQPGELSTALSLEFIAGGAQYSPNLINGCDVPALDSDCFITSPISSDGTDFTYEDLIIDSDIGAYTSSGVDIVSGGGIIDGTYAVWSSAVPVPAATWLLGSALIGLVGIKRKS